MKKCIIGFDQTTCRLVFYRRAYHYTDILWYHPLVLYDARTRIHHNDIITYCV